MRTTHAFKLVRVRDNGGYAVYEFRCEWCEMAFHVTKDAFFRGVKEDLGSLACEDQVPPVHVWYLDGPPEPKAPEPPKDFQLMWGNEVMHRFDSFASYLEWHSPENLEESLENAWIKVNPGLANVGEIPTEHPKVSLWTKIKYRLLHAIGAA